jgi:hypothetical protein
MLPVVLHGCEFLSLALRGLNRLRVFENRALRKILAPIMKKLQGAQEIA